MAQPFLEHQRVVSLVVLYIHAALRMGPFCSLLLCLTALSTLAQEPVRSGVLHLEIEPRELLVSDLYWLEPTPPGWPLSAPAGSAGEFDLAVFRRTLAHEALFDIEQEQALASPLTSILLGEITEESAPPLRFILLHVQSGQPFLPSATSRLLYEPPVDFTDFDLALLHAAATSIVPLLTWMASRDHETLPFPATRLVMPYVLATRHEASPHALDTNHIRLVAQGLAVAQIHGKVFDTLRYDLYTGVVPDNHTHTLLTGARLGYTFGNSGVTLGVNYGYGVRDAAVPNALALFNPRNHNLPESDTYRLFGVDILYDKGRFSLAHRITYEVDTQDSRRLKVFTEPTLQITPQWKVFYRFDYVSLGYGLAKRTEHIMGMRLLPSERLRLRAEFIVQEMGEPPEDGWGFRLLGTLRF
jgi:hypothetical protein